jgi:two-component system KDP operon response regulator KdpE
MPLYTLLVVARSQALARQLERALQGDTYHVRWVPGPTQAIALPAQPALLVVELPPSGGAATLGRLRQRFGLPMLAIRRAGQPAPSGVEASLERPFETEELARQVDALVMASAPGLVRVPGMWLELTTRRLQVNGSLHQLTPLGSQIVAVLMASAGCVVIREELFRRVWNTEHGDNTRALDVHIAHLRRIIEPDPRHPKLIITERGRGYRLEPPGAAQEGR